MKFYIDFETFESNFYNNWAENNTGVVNYFKTEDKIYFFIKWVWDYVLVMRREEIVQIMDRYNDQSVQYNTFCDRLDAFIKKYFGNAIYCRPQQEMQNETNVNIEVSNDTEQL